MMDIKVEILKLKEGLLIIPLENIQLNLIKLLISEIVEIIVQVKIALKKNTLLI